MRRGFKNEYLRRLELQGEAIQSELKKRYKKVAIQKLWIDKLVAGREIGVFNGEWKFKLFYYDISKKDIQEFMNGSQGGRYSIYELIEIKSTNEIFLHYGIEGIDITLTDRYISFQI